MPDYTTMQRKDLIPIATDRGIPAWGSRDQIAERLTKADQTVPQPQGDQPVVKIVAGPDTGADNDNGDGLLQALADQPPAPPAAPPERQLSAAERENIELRAQLLQMQAQLLAKPGAAPTGGEAATPEVIARAARGEQVFRTDFPMYDGMELGDGLHESFIRQTAQRAHEAGFRTRGAAHRVDWGRDADGNRTAVYEIYARKE